MAVLFIALAPVIAILFYIYWRDKYEQEPWRVLLWAFVFGGIITVPVYFIEVGLTSLGEEHFGIGKAMSNKFLDAAYGGVVVAGFTEELFKYLVFILFIFRHKEFNEKFDGIVYAVFIGMGFAAIENILYVVQHGAGVGILRALTAVPAHALFGVAMGYHFSLAKFGEHRALQLIMALALPLVLHGFYDFILMADSGYLLFLFIPYVLVLWLFGFRRMKRHSDASVFK